MNFLDLIILGVIGLSTLLAFSRGFIKELLSILGWIGAVIATVAFFGPVRVIVPLIETSRVPSLTMMNSSRACLWGGCEAWPGFSVVMCDSNFSNVAVGKSTTSRRVPNALGFTLSSSQTKTREPSLARVGAEVGAGD